MIQDEQSYEQKQLLMEMKIKPLLFLPVQFLNYTICSNSIQVKYFFEIFQLNLRGPHELFFLLQPMSIYCRI